jgi:outer membrane receptor protein involved in Fe transport
VYQGSAWSDLRSDDRLLLGKQPAFSIVDLSAGVSNDSYGIELFVKNVFDERAEVARFAQCGNFQPLTTPPNSVQLCGAQPYTVTNLPRTIGVTFSKKF